MSVDTSGRRFMKSGTQFSLPCRYMTVGSSGRWPTVWQNTGGNHAVGRSPPPALSPRNCPDLLPSIGRADTACDYCCEPPGSVRFFPARELYSAATSSKASAIASSLTDPATRL